MGSRAGFFYPARVRRLPAIGYLVLDRIHLPATHPDLLCLMGGGWHFQGLALAHIVEDRPENVVVIYSTQTASVAVATGGVP